MDTHSHSSQQKNAAERIRPILQAMEASINSARRNRVKEVEPRQPTPMDRAALASRPSIPSISSIPSIPAAQIAPASSPDATQRLKAKPKRMNSPFNPGFDQTAYRSQAG